MASVGASLQPDPASTKMGAMPNWTDASSLLEDMSEAETNHLASRFSLASPDEIRQMRRTNFDHRKKDTPKRVAAHGSRTMYTYGCRCEPCCTEESVYQRGRYQSTKEAP